MGSEIKRRSLIAAGLGIAGAGALVTLAGARTVVTARTTGAGELASGTWKGARSQNGWPVIGAPATHRIEGAGGTTAAFAPAAAAILLHVARRFNYEIDELRAGDVVGHTTDRKLRQAYESNHLSGTAVAIRSSGYPLGAGGGLFPAELVVVRDILAECGGVVSWGGDEKVPKESHFQIAVKPGDPRVKRLAARFGRLDELPGTGTGLAVGAGAIDAFVPSRRRAARAFRAAQLRRS